MGDSFPHISIIIPTYNRASLVGRAVKSVLAQTYQDFELIIVNDASTDETDEILRSFNDERIRYIRHKNNIGGSGARNTGIKLATGKYIAFIDDDDEWLPEKIELQVLRFQKVSHKVGLVYTGLEVRDNNSNLVKKKYPPAYKGDVKLNLLESTTIGSPTPLIKKECFETVGLFDESLKSCQDWDMWKRISEQYEFDYAKGFLALSYTHHDQLSYNYACLIPGRTAMVEKHMKEFRKYPKILIIHLKRLGKLHCLNGTWQQAIYWFREVLKINRLEIFKIIAWLIIELPRAKLFSEVRNFKRYQ
jgi:glycosyltransferase involved in cell wall biosynthesis